MIAVEVETDRTAEEVASVLAEWKIQPQRMEPVREIIVGVLDLAIRANVRSISIEAAE